MTKLLAVSIALAALVGASAKAADTSMLKTPIPNEPPFAVYNWTGFYIGIQGGGGWARVEQTDALSFPKIPSGADSRREVESSHQSGVSDPGGRCCYRSRPFLRLCGGAQVGTLRDRQRACRLGDGPPRLHLCQCRPPDVKANWDGQPECLVEQCRTTLRNRADEND